MSTTTNKSKYFTKANLQSTEADYAHGFVPIYLATDKQTSGHVEISLQKGIASIVRCLSLSAPIRKARMVILLPLVTRVEGEAEKATEVIMVGES